MRAQNYIPIFKQMGLDFIVTAGTPTESGPPKGALAIDKTNGLLYQNTGTASSATWTQISLGSSIGTSEIEALAITTALLANNAVTSAKLDETTIQYAEVEISAADIVATGAGKFGHASGYPLVAAPGATKVLELVSAVLIYDYDTAAYTDGGNITVNSEGGSALTGLISAANSVGAGADKIVGFVPLATAGVALTADKGLYLVSSAAFTQPGTAAGVIRVKVAYRVHTHGLA